MAVLFSESFDDGTPGATITAPGTAFAYIQPNPTYTATSVLGAGAMRATWTSVDTAPLVETTPHAALTTVYYRMYVRLGATGTLFYFFQALSGTTSRAALSSDGAGGVRMRQGTTGIGVTSTAKLSTTAYTRIEYAVSPTTLQLRMYQGVDLHGTTPTYDSGPVSWTLGGSWDRERIGSVLAVANADVLIDEFAADNTTWVGPAATSTPRSGSAELTTVTTLTASGKTTRRGTGALTTTTSLAGSGQTARRGAATLTTATTLAAAGTTTKQGTASLTTSTTLDAQGARTTRGNTGITTKTTLEATGQTTRAGAAALQTNTTFTVTGSAPSLDARTGTAHLTTITTLTASGTTNRTGAADLTTATTLNGAGTTTRVGTATLTTTTVLTATGNATITGRNITVTATLGPRTTQATLSERATRATVGARRWEGTL